jgi:hypothetical protein
VKNKLINQKKYRLKADGLLDPPLKETGLRKPFVQIKRIGEVMSFIDYFGDITDPLICRCDIIWYWIASYA